jgi:cobalt-zinc-cadmium efflux system outer membrane protein
MTMWIRRFILIVVLACCGAAAYGVQPPSATSEELYPDISRLSLRQAETLFLVRSREVQAARRNVEGAEADRLSAAARPNPVLGVSTLGMGSSITSRDNPHSLHFADAYVSLSQTLERGSKRELRTEAAQFGIDASYSDLADTLRVQQVALAGAYYDLLFAQSRADIAQDSAQLFRQTVAAVELRLKAGDVAASDVARIRVDALRAENEARLARSEVEKAQSALAYLIGAESEARRVVAEDRWPPVTLPVEPPIETILDRRADIQAAIARLRGSEKRVDLARALRTRDVTVGVEYEIYRSTYTGDTVGVAASVPLFTNYYFEGEIARAEVEHTAALENLERLRALALGDIQRARADLEAAAERSKRFDGALLTEAERAAKGAEFAYEKGAAGVLELLDARRTLFATRVEAIAAHADYARALTAWRAALGEKPTGTAEVTQEEIRSSR